MNIEATCTGSPFDRDAAFTARGDRAAQRGTAGAKTTDGPGKKLSSDEKKQLEELKARDTHVRAHEAAHLAAAGGAATGPAHFDYQRGPDGQLYAVGGEVPIALSRDSRNPQITLQRAEQVYRAALAPSDPSGQDLAVAAEAMQVAVDARREIGKSPASGGGAIGYDARGKPVAPGRSPAPTRDAAGNCTCVACRPS